MTNHRSDQRPGLREVTRVAQALSDTNRARVLAFLRHGELCLCQIVGMLGLAPSTVSRHMSLLTQAGLATARKEGRWMYFGLPPPGSSSCAREAVQWILKHMDREEQIKADEQRLRRLCRQSRETLSRCYQRRRPRHA